MLDVGSRFGAFLFIPRSYRHREYVACLEITDNGSIQHGDGKAAEGGALAGEGVAHSIFIANQCLVGGLSKFKVQHDIALVGRKLRVRFVQLPIHPC